MDGSENRIRIEADRRHVVEALTDPTIYPLWLVGSQGIRAVDDDWPAPHSKFHHRTRTLTPPTAAEGFFLAA